MIKRMVLMAGAVVLVALAILWSGVLPATALPDPVADFTFLPVDPSMLDTVQFLDTSYDANGIQSWAWDFGDGATATSQSPGHQYAADGDYTVHLTVTAGGIQASVTHVVAVRTHDVAIIKCAAPNSAKVGQARQIVVGVGNHRYSEGVEVQLYKLVSGAPQLVGTLTQTVPALSGNHTTDFKFDYTFSSDDAALGTVTFRAVAIIVAARDCLPSNNEVIASPTRVK